MVVIKIHPTANDWAGGGKHDFQADRGTLGEEPRGGRFTVDTGVDRWTRMKQRGRHGHVWALGQGWSSQGRPSSVLSFNIFINWCHYFYSWQVLESPIIGGQARKFTSEPVQHRAESKGPCLR